MSTGEFGQNVHAIFFLLFFQRVRATSMTQRRAENTLAMANLSRSRLYRLSFVRKDPLSLFEVVLGCFEADFFDTEG